jgi:hypothetical protein
MKFMLLQYYGGVEGLAPMSEWTPEEAQALTAPELAKRVVSDGSAPVVTDGPFPESKELLAGYRMIDVESQERAIEIAARGSAAPGPGGAPIRDRIEVREVMWMSEGE